jgi:hypothetical protein
MTGAVAPRKAVEEFLGAVKAQDLQAMSVVWGTEQGPARDHLDRTELEKREIIMQTCFNHDRFTILEEGPGVAGRRVLRVQIARGTKTKTPSFTTVKGPSDRWYVLDGDILAVQEFCRS